MIMRIVLQDHQIKIWYGTSKGKFRKFALVNYSDSVYNKLLNRIENFDVQTIGNVIIVNSRAIYFV